MWCGVRWGGEHPRMSSNNNEKRKGWRSRSRASYYVSFFFCFILQRTGTSTKKTFYHVLYCKNKPTLIPSKLCSQKRRHISEGDKLTTLPYRCRVSILSRIYCRSVCSAVLRSGRGLEIIPLNLCLSPFFVSSLVLDGVLRFGEHWKFSL